MTYDKDKTIPLDQDRPVPDRGGWFWPIMIAIITCAGIIGLLLLFLEAFTPV